MTPRQDESQDVLGQVTVDRSSPIPLYFQLSQQLERAVEEGRLTPGTRIDNELDFARRLGLSRPTVRRALESLVDAGVIVRRRGIGTRVVSPKVRRPLELTSLYDDLERSRQRPTTTVLANSVEEASDEVAQALGVRAGAPVIAIVRLRRAMAQPIARMSNYLPIGRVEIETEALESGGLYNLLRTAGIQLHSATQVIGARLATGAEARLLDERTHTALLTMQRIARDDRGAVVEYGTHIYAATRYSFELNLLST